MDLTKRTLQDYDLSKYDFKILIDKSGSMGATDVKDGGAFISRWKQAHRWSKIIANICNQFDDDGIDVILFDHNVTIYNNVTDSKVDEIFRMNTPGGSTATDKAIREAVPEYFKRGLFSGGGKVTRKKPVILIIFTDGEPNDKSEVMEAIIDITKRISSRSEIGISFLQVGNDVGARNFLKKLDDDLVPRGAAFDIVDTKTYEETATMSANDVLLHCLID